MYADLILALLFPADTVIGQRLVRRGSRRQPSICVDLQTQLHHQPLFDQDVDPSLLQLRCFLAQVFPPNRPRNHSNRCYY
jgi:hypothetical protein